MAGLGLLALWLESEGFFDRKIGAVEPQKAENSTDKPPREAGVYYIRASEDGFFWVDAWVNNDPVRFLVDTGASHIILTRETAYGLGFDLWDEEFDREVKTADDETVPAASIMLDEVNIGDEVIVHNVRALVLDGGDTNFLGMSFLARLKSYRVEGRELVLKGY